MKKQFTILFLLIANFSIAQTYTLASDTISETVPFADVQADQWYTFGALNHLINNTSDTVQSTWHRTVQYLTPGWATYVCDPNNCYGETTDNADFTFVPNANALVYVDFKPQLLSGYGVVKVVFNKIGNPLDLVEGTFIGIVDVGSGISSTEILNDIKLFPNPANDNLIIVTTDEINSAAIEVYDVLGKKMNPFIHKQGDNIFCADISSYRNGFYFIKMNLKNGTTVTRRFTKN